MSALAQFVLKTLLFLPLTFAVWYGLAFLHLAPATVITEQLIHWLAPDALLWLRIEGHELVIVSNFEQLASGIIQTLVQNEEALGFQQKPLIYTYSLPLLWALILATPKLSKASSLLWGSLCLLPCLVFSMSFQVLKVLSSDLGAAFIEQQNWLGWQVDIVALGYQMGTLLIPMITPLLVWAWFSSDSLQQLTHSKSSLAS